MKSCGFRLALITGLALAGAATTASASALRPMSDSEMSDVSGRGLVPPMVLAALGAQEQRSTYGSAADAQAAQAELSSQVAGQLAMHEMSALQLQNGTVSMQNAIKDAQMMAKIAQTLASASTTLPGLAALPGLLGLMSGLGGLGGLGGAGAAGGSLGALGALGALGGLNGLTSQSQPPASSTTPTTSTSHGH